jgi:hypothetical protein
MRRPLISCAPMFMMVALAPAALFAQTPPAQTTPPATAQPPATAPATTPPPAAEPKLTFTAPAGLLLIQIKPDQAAVFEEMLTKLRAGLEKSTDAALKSQYANFKVYKASEPMGAEKNALFVIVADPVTGPTSEYEFFATLQKVMTPDELRAPETIEMFTKFSGAFAAPYNKLNLTPVK